MARKVLTGDKQLEATLQGLADKSADKVARSALGAGLSVIAKAMKAGAPKGGTQNLANNIGKRLIKGEPGGLLAAKAGANVGKRTSKRLEKNFEKTGRLIGAPHAHLVALGTAPRKRKSIGGEFRFIRTPTEAQLSTGMMPANPFIRVAMGRAGAEALIAMRKQAEKRLAKELSKLKK